MFIKVLTLNDRETHLIQKYWLSLDKKIKDHLVRESFRQFKTQRNFVHTKENMEHHVRNAYALVARGFWFQLGQQQDDGLLTLAVNLRTKLQEHRANVRLYLGKIGTAFAPSYFLGCSAFPRSRACRRRGRSFEQKKATKEEEEEN